MSSFQEWYIKNKDKLSEKRKTLYANNPEYRERAKASSRETKKRIRTSTKVVPSDPIYTHSLQKVLDDCSASYFQFKEWRDKEYLPKPKKFGREIIFTATQAHLFKELRIFMANRNRDKKKLSLLVDYIAANWE